MSKPLSPSRPWRAQRLIWPKPTAARIAALVWAAFAALSLTGPASAASKGEVVIVQAKPGQELVAEQAIANAGGTVARRLPVLDSFVVKVPAAGVSQLRLTDAVQQVTQDYTLKPQGLTFDGALSTMGSIFNTTKITGAQDFWRAGYTGKGVDVALIDSGVSPVEGLKTPGKVVNGPDISFESRYDEVRYLDSYGHGTHMAGIIAGRESGLTDATSAINPDNFGGMAPDARIVSVKVAEANGATDVSQVIAAIAWVIEHKNDNGLNVRVLNLSYGVDSKQDRRYDPLSHAVEVAWKNGIFVVVATGNKGSVSTTSTMLSPATNPFVMAVGAADPGVTTSMADDIVAPFSSVGTPSSSTRDPDLVAPGKSIHSLRVPGSFIDEQYGAVAGVGGLFKGSGTSQAAAVVSGAAALVIQQRPSITPDQLKKLLRGTAQDLYAFGAHMDGKGELNLKAALAAATPSVWDSAQSFEASTGRGTLEAARGTDHVSKDGVVLQGERDIFGQAWDSALMADAIATRSSWTGGDFNRSSWTGSSWTGSSWTGSSWTGSSWTGSSWTGSSWTGSSWTGSSWTGSSWTGSSWTGSSWTGSSWTGSSWTGSSWTNSLWG